MHCRLIPTHSNDIVNPIITSKPRLRARFGSTMIKHDFMLPPQKMWVKGKVIHVKIKRRT